LSPTLIVVSVLTAGACLYSFWADYIYFATLLAFFAIPAQLLAGWSWPRLDFLSKLAAIGSILSIGVCAVIMEFIGIHFDFWTFMEDADALLGIAVGDIPIEEFLFYYLALAQLVFLYMALKLRFESRGLAAGAIAHRFDAKHTNGGRRGGLLMFGAAAAAVAALFGAGWAKNRDNRDGHAESEGPGRDARGRPRYAHGKWGPAWFAAVAPYFLIALVAFRKALRRIHCPALAIAFGINMPLYLLWEYNALIRGHWVYNEQLLLGIKLGITPIEELFLYVTAILLGISVLEIIRAFLAEAYAKHEAEVVSAGNGAVSGSR
jgi:lycopene cyclase domain-containing protein